MLVDIDARERAMVDRLECGEEERSSVLEADVDIGPLAL